MTQENCVENASVTCHREKKKRLCGRVRRLNHFPLKLDMTSRCFTVLDVKTNFQPVLDKHSEPTRLHHTVSPDESLFGRRKEMKKGHVTDKSTETETSLSECVNSNSGGAGTLLKALSQHRLRRLQSCWWKAIKVSTRGPINV